MARSQARWTTHRADACPTQKFSGSYLSLENYFGGAPSLFRPFSSIPFFLISINNTPQADNEVQQRFNISTDIPYPNFVGPPFCQDVFGCP